MIRHVVSIVFAWCVVFGTSRADIIINTIQDFSSVQGANGWRYGFQTGVDGTQSDYDFGAFQQMLVYDTSAIDDLGEPAWTMSGWVSTAHAASGTYLDDANEYAIRRWTAGEDGTLNLSLAAENLPLFGEGVLISVAMNGSMLSTVTLAEGELFSFDFVNQSVTSGDTIDVLFSSHAGLPALSTFNGIGFLESAPVSAAVPEPSTMLALVAGSLAYAAWQRRRMPSAHSDDLDEESA